MAKKKAAVTEEAAWAPTPEVDKLIVQEAYNEAVKKQVSQYFGNCIDGVSNPEKRFLTGLKIIRQSCIRALELVGS